MTGGARRVARGHSDGGLRAGRWLWRWHWHWHWLLPLSLAAFASPGFGQGSVTELLAFRGSESLHAEARAQGLLDSLTMGTIESGLPGACVYELHLEGRSGELVAERLAERSLRFDVWERRYLLESKDGTIVLPTPDAAVSAFSHLAVRDLCPLSWLSPTEEYRLTLQIAVRSLGVKDEEFLFGFAEQVSSGGEGGIAINLSRLFKHVTAEKTKSSRKIVEGASPFFHTGDLDESP